MRNLKLKNLITLCLFILVGFSHAQEIESIISYDLTTRTSYTIDECSYQTVGELNPIYWIDKQNDFIQTEVTETHYDDCSVKTEIIYVDSDNYFPSWMKRKPHRLVIDMDNSTAYDERGLIITKVPRSSVSIEAQLNLCNTYFDKYFESAYFSNEWAQSLIRIGFIRVDLDRYTYKLISDDIIYIINNRDLTVTTLVYENGELVSQNIIKKAGIPLRDGQSFVSNNGTHLGNVGIVGPNGINIEIDNDSTLDEVDGTETGGDGGSGGNDVISVLDDVIIKINDTNPDGTKVTKVVSKDYENYEISFFQITKGRSLKEEFEKEIFIYPNPAIDFVTIEQKVNQVTQLRLVNARGFTVYTNDNFQGKDKINTTSLHAGIYFVQLSNKDETITDKLIIK